MYVRIREKRRGQVCSQRCWRRTVGGPLMEPLRILVTATVLLAITAVGGIVMAGMRLAGKDYPPTSFARRNADLREERMDPRE
ncbi:hypothetical protein C0Z17_09400 [Trinickia caryophylli]|nr:hypothetical protein C0Z17_09400 [Trinickia caryophylli]